MTLVEQDGYRGCVNHALPRTTHCLCDGVSMSEHEVPRGFADLRGSRGRGLHSYVGLRQALYEYSPGEYLMFRTTLTCKTMNDPIQFRRLHLASVGRMLLHGGSMTGSPWCVSSKSRTSMPWSAERGVIDGPIGGSRAGGRPTGKT